MNRQHHDEDAPRVRERSPANRLGVDYRNVPAREVATPITDVHTHVHDVPGTARFFEAAELYGIRRVVSMTPLEECAPLARRFPGRLEWIAIPRWRSMSLSMSFQRQWMADLDAFRELGARRMKFWMAPPMRGRHGVTLRDAFFAPLIRHGLDLGYDFMIHVGDPSEWFEPGGKYADSKIYGTKVEQYWQLEYLLETVAPRNVIAAHMGGFCENPAFLDQLLARYDNLYLDTSATKWIVRAVAARPEAVRDLFLRWPDRLLFGSDLVVAADYDFDHYASRYWAHLMMWETDYRGESPIDDPDAAGAPQLAGVDLPADLLRRVYATNAAALGHGGSHFSDKRTAKSE